VKTPILRAAFSTAFGNAEVWNLLMPRGEYHGANLSPIGGSIVIDDALLSEMVANWKDAGSPPLPIRKTHRHLDDDVPAVDRPELEKAFGFLTDFRVTAQGLEAKTEWNPAGKATVDAKEFAFWSPEWQPKHRDRRTGDVKGWWLSGTALTNDPFFQEMPPVAASAVDASTEPTRLKEQNNMKPELKKRLFAALKLSETCTDEELTAACEAACHATASVISADTITAAVAPVKAQLETLTATLAKKDEQLSNLTASLLERDVNQAIAEGLRGDGKTGRALEPLRPFILATAKSAGLEEAKKLIAAVPLSVPMQSSSQPGTADGPLTKEAAQKKLNARAEELRAAKVADPMFAAMREMPEVALVASTQTTAA
jgi:phage I-like protein